MTEAESTDSDSAQERPEITWGNRFKSSLLIGLVIAIIWMVIVVVAGVYDPRGAEGMSGLTGNGFGIFVIISSLAFVIKAVWYYVRKAMK